MTTNRKETVQFPMDQNEGEKLSKYAKIEYNNGSHMWNNTWNYMPYNNYHPPPGYYNQVPNSNDTNTGNTSETHNNYQSAHNSSQYQYNGTDGTSWSPAALSYSGYAAYNNYTYDNVASMQYWAYHQNYPTPPELPKPNKIPIPEVKQNPPLFQATPDATKPFVAASNSVPKVQKLDELYPISKGDVHKISEDKMEIEPVPSGSTQSTATIINCPLPNTYGARLLTKMGWRFGEGLGKDGDGIVTAVKFRTKIDRLGLASAVEKHSLVAASGKKAARVKADIDKNPVSVLMEYCQRNRCPPAVYTDVEEIGPTNMRQFRISVTILDKTYLSPNFYKTKKEARAGSASLAVKELNL